MTMNLHKEIIPGIPVREPEFVPAHDAVLLGYELVDEHKKKFYTKPDPTNMSFTGWASVVVLTLIFWPLSCVPCCLSCSYPVYQRPVYSSVNTISELPTQ